MPRRISFILGDVSIGLLETILPGAALIISPSFNHITYTSSAALFQDAPTPEATAIKIAIAA